MNRARFTLMLFVILLCPAVAQAHSLSLTYYPIGPVPFYLAVEWWPLSALIPLSITVEALVLWTWARSLGMPKSLLRGAVLYVTARVAETAAMHLLGSIPLFLRAGWSSSSAENLGPLALFLLAGLLVAVPVGLLLYGRTDMKGPRVVIAVCTASLASYSSALAGSLILVTIRGY